MYRAPCVCVCDFYLWNLQHSQLPQNIHREEMNRWSSIFCPCIPFFSDKLPSPHILREKNIEIEFLKTLFEPMHEMINEKLEKQKSILAWLYLIQQHAFTLHRYCSGWRFLTKNQCEMDRAWAELVFELLNDEPGRKNWIEFTKCGKKCCEVQWNVPSIMEHEISLPSKHKIQCHFTLFDNGLEKTFKSKILYPKSNNDIFWIQI